MANVRDTFDPIPQPHLQIGPATVPRPEASNPVTTPDCQGVRATLRLVVTTFDRTGRSGVDSAPVAPWSDQT